VVKITSKANGTPVNQYGEMTFISEGNLYRLVLKSGKPEAEPFEKWVCDEVLPSIRKHGMYATPDTMEKMLTDPDFIIQLATKLKEETAARKEATNALKEAEGVIIIKDQQLELQESTIKEQSPKVEYHDKVLTSNNVIKINDIANDLGVSAIKLNKILEKFEIQYKQGSGDRWYLHSKYRGHEYTKDITFPHTDGEGRTTSSIHMYWTQKGRRFIYSQFIKNIHKLPEVIQINISKINT
jgi:anti-repressor protein